MILKILTEDDFNAISVFGQDKIIRIKAQVKKMFEKMIKDSGRPGLSPVKSFHLLTVFRKMTEFLESRCIHP